ncbi:MAG: nucleoside hydrolase [Planctomycetales bacterium]
MARKVIIDTDPGVDDAVALTMALFDPRFDVVAVTAVAGNVPAEQATRNVQAIIEQLDPPRLPRIGAASAPDEGLPATSQHIFGQDGLGNANFQVAELHNIHQSEKVLIEEIRAAPEEITVIALGPLTNIARALTRDSSWASQLGQLIIMGGTVTHPGNVSPTAEFNVFCDPPAAARVFQSRTTKTLTPLDVTEQLVFNYDLFDQLPGEDTRAGAFLRKILPFAFRSHHQELGLEGVHLHDAVTMAAAALPDLFTFEEMIGDVETRGDLTRGMTVFDRRTRPDAQPNIDVACEMDVDDVFNFILASLRHAGQETA